jgi:hypothetical protein
MIKHVQQYDNVFTKEEMRLLLNQRIESSSNDGRLGDLLVRRDTTDPKWIQMYSMIESKITTVVASHLERYCKLVYFDSMSISHIGFVNDYDGSFTETHYDAEMVIFKGEMIVKPLIVLIYLNDGYTGGELVFPLEGFTSKPTEGSIVIFPSGFAFPHVSMPVTNGSKHLCRITYKMDNDYFNVAVMEI